MLGRPLLFYLLYFYLFIYFIIYDSTCHHNNHHRTSLYLISIDETDYHDEKRDELIGKYNSCNPQVRGSEMPFAPEHGNLKHNTANISNSA
jgi:hypothetical protein